MKQKNFATTIIALITFAAINVATAADYSEMTTDELVNMRSQIGNMSTQDYDSYRSEMRSRVQSMSTDERASFQQANSGNRQGSGDGKGNQYRYGQGSSGGGSYGSGYGSRQGGGGKYRQ